MPRNSLKKTLANISETQSLDQLDIFKDQSKWKSLEKDDLHLLADLFIKKGSSEIKKEPRQAEESFEIALKLTSFDPYVSIKISDLWAKSSKWDEAVEEVKRTLERYPKHEEAWTQLATLYLQKGRFSRDDEFLDKSREVFEYLMELKAILPPFAYHLWGQTYLLSGRFSEEPCDFTMALEKFKEAEKQGFADHHLFSDHSMALF
jgi:tetratricopeptide (TPR) repeat protein